MAGLRLGLWMKYLAGFRLAPFVPTPEHVGLAMLKLAGVCSSDMVLDVGCGDGRLLISAAKQHGARGCGLEMDARLAKQAISAIEREGLAHMISVLHTDALQATSQLQRASVVTLYLSDAGNAKLLPHLQRQLSQNARVVSFCWPFQNLTPSRIQRVNGIALYLYDFNALHNISPS